MKWPSGWLAGLLVGGGEALALAEVNVATVRTALMLAEEPAAAVSLDAARKKLGTTPQPIVVVGRIGAKGMEPFLEGKASFSLV